MPNIFKRRGSSTSGPSSSTPNKSNFSGKGSKTGIRIAADNNSTENNNSFGQQQQKSSFSSQNLDPSNLLPPESNYRTSLIMPHLTRRFTLLRAPDGTMVTPEAMRAHLRAQRARARATGIPGTQCFLTEEEEDEIIDQLRRQTRMEESMDEWDSMNNNQQQQQQPPIPQQNQNTSPPMEFGGTDGFGSWSAPYKGHQRSDSKIDASIAESLSNLPLSANSRSDDHTTSPSGRFFTSSSSNRDLAYINEVQKSRAKRSIDGSSSNSTGHDESQSGERKSTNTNRLSLIRDEESDADRTSRGESITPVRERTPVDNVNEIRDEISEKDAMPGDFLIASHRESRRLSASNSDDIRSDTFLSPPNPNAVTPRKPRNSELLTNLTPEAFNRVSMALEEVYEMVSGRVEDGEDEEDGEEEGGNDYDVDSEIETRSNATMEKGNNTLRSYDANSATYPGLERDTDQSSELQESLDEGSGRIRPSMESETNSFTSAQSEVAASAMEGHGRSEAFNGIGNAAMLSSLSREDGITNSSAPIGWSVSSQRNASSRSGENSLDYSQQQNKRGYPSKHVAGKGSMGSSGASSLMSQQGVSSRQNSPSLRRPMNTPPIEPKSPIGTNPLTIAAASGGSQANMISPLAAGFHLAGGNGGGSGQNEMDSKAAAAAAAAAATAAGVAAARYVAQAQKHQKEQKEIASANATLTNINDDESIQMSQSNSNNTIVPISNEITMGEIERSDNTVGNELQYQQSQPALKSTPEVIDSVDSNESSSAPAAAAAVTTTTATTTSSSSPTIGIPPSRPSAAENQVLSANAIAARSPKYFPTASNRSMHSYAAGFLPVVPTTKMSSKSISPAISEDEATEDDEDDIWANVARNSSSTPVLHQSLSDVQSQPIQVEQKKVDDLENESQDKELNQESIYNKSGISIDELHKIQSDLVRSASSKQSTGKEIVREPEPLPTTANEKQTTSPPVPAQLRPSEGGVPTDVKADTIISPPQSAQIFPTSRPPMKEKESETTIKREQSSRSFRSQVMYDVTSSHRPTSPPPRTHKTSLSNLPTLQDLSKGVAPGWSPGGGSTDRNSVSLISMLETSARVHDQLSEGDSQTIGKSNNISGATIPEEEVMPDEYEDVAIEDGFGGFTYERRKRLPRSQSHDVLSSTRLTDFDADKRNSQGMSPIVNSAQFTPKSFRSEPGMERDDDDGDESGATWSRIPGEEPFVSTNLIDDVAAQAIAATKALKGETGEKPRLRTKSLGKVRKNLSKAISQPQLVSTTQRMEHTQGLVKVDESLRKREIAQRKPLPHQMRSSSLASATSPTSPKAGNGKQSRQQQQPLQSPKQSNIQSPKIRPTQSQQNLPSSAAPQIRQKDSQFQSPPQKPMVRSGSTNTIRSRSTSPTDYKNTTPTDYKTKPGPSRKDSNTSVNLKRSSSFGHRGPLDSNSNLSQSSQFSPTRSGSIGGNTKNSSPGTPQSSNEKGQSGLGRFITRMRGRKASDLPTLVEPFPNDNNGKSGSNSSPGLNNPTTPSTLSSPVFKTPKESPNQFQFGLSPGVGKADTFAGRSPGQNSSMSPLSDMFNENGSAIPPPRSTSQGKKLNNQIAGGNSMSNDTISSKSSLAPAAPIHARLARGAPMYNNNADKQQTISNNNNNNGGGRGSSMETNQSKAARDTIVRRTIIVSTFEPNNDDRRKSSSVAAIARKNSLRKSTLPSQQQQGGSNYVSPNQSSSGGHHHRRTSSTTSSKLRRSVQDRPATPPGPDGVSGTHRRKLSQEVTGKPLPPTARNVYEAPLPFPNNQINSLNIPSQQQQQQGSFSRASNVSGYGASLYDLYDRDDDETEGFSSKRPSGSFTGGGLYPPPNMPRQSSDLNTAGGGAARHIEVTERADGSVVWQVIAGLADRSSTYSASIGYGGGHSRQNSDTSSYSFMRNQSTNGGSMSPMGRPNALADEDGRSLFARTRGKKSFSMDGGERVPPLPNSALTNEYSISADTDSTRNQSQQQQQQQATPLDFEMATTAAGQAATRIVYTSDAELAAMLESLAGPDKSSAKFAFQRIFDQESSSSSNNTTAKVSKSSNDNDNSSGVQVGSNLVELNNPFKYDGNNGFTTGNQQNNNGRPVSIWTESEITSDPTGALRSQRFKIEAEIYSLLQREGHPSAPATGAGAGSSSSSPSSPAAVATSKSANLNNIQSPLRNNFVVES